MAKEKNFFKMSVLHSHRVGVVRTVARAAHLAHTYLRGQPYKLAERTKKTEPRLYSWHSSVPEGVLENVRRFGPPHLREMDKKELLEDLKKWVEGGTGLALENSKSQAVGSTPTTAS